MNWQYFKYFDLIAREEHLTRAAEKLYITRSALSKSMDNLEEELGVPLFIKQGRNIRLTTYGMVLSRYVSRATSEILCGIEAIQSMACPAEGTVTVAGVHSASTQILPKLVKAFSHEYPGIRLVCYELPTEELLDSLCRREIDFGICSSIIPRKRDIEIETETIAVEELLLAVPPTHRLAFRKAVSFSELLEDWFVGYTNNTGMNEALEEALQPRYSVYQLRYSCFAGEEKAVASMIKEEMGIGFLPAGLDIDGLSLLHVTDPRLTRTLYLVSRADASLTPAAKLCRHFFLAEIPRIIM